MTTPDPPRRPKLPSRPDLPRAVVGDEQPERSAVNHPGVDGSAQPPPARRGTLPGMPSLPQPPPLPRELARTQRAPSTTAATVRATPAMGQEAVRVAEPATGQPGAATGELEALRNQVAEYERRERVRSESQGPGPYQRPIERKPSPAPVSVAPASKPPTRGDWSKLGYRFATAVVAALIAVMAPLGYWAIAAINARIDAYKVEQKEVADAGRQRKQSELRWKAEVRRVLDCRHRKQSALNARQFPESPRAGGGWPIWKDECGELPEPPQEPSP